MRLEPRPTVHLFLEYLEQQGVIKTVSKEKKDEVISAWLRDYYAKHPEMKDYGYGRAGGGGMTTF